MLKSCEGRSHQIHSRSLRDGKSTDVPNCGDDQWMIFQHIN